MLYCSNKSDRGKSLIVLLMIIIFMFLHQILVSNHIIFLALECFIVCQAYKLGFDWNKGGGEGHTFQASNSDQEQQSSSIQLSFTMEQLDRLYKILESNTLSGSVAPKGTSALFSVSPSRAWIVDSGASDHMTGDSTLFSSYSPCAGFELGEDDW
ncbi:unnamed protein product [Trifolium pratense]|uniref:Uncharacterized protein n=1 Tax=Trifolium pratense TaxID=57577 RepID=A0ACB0LVC0_TRIPR|nr:unnamed protein product [Trifolium pratense]